MGQDRSTCIAACRAAQDEINFDTGCALFAASTAARQTIYQPGRADACPGHWFEYGAVQRGLRGSAAAVAFPVPRSARPGFRARPPIPDPVGLIPELQGLAIPEHIVRGVRRGAILQHDPDG